jgi:hypothetical protein
LQLRYTFGNDKEIEMNEAGQQALEKAVELEKRVVALTEIVNGIEKREQEKCTHDYEEGSCVPVFRKVTNGIEVQVPNVAFGMPVLVQTNLSWDMRVCRLCGDFMVKLPKGLQIP